MREVGFKEYEPAKSGLAECLVCHLKINKGAWRCLYRFLRSTHFRDERFIHAECARGLPQAHRADDIATLERWRCDVGGGARAMLVATLAALKGGASGSGG